MNQVLEPYTLVSVQLITGNAGHRVASCTIRNEATGEEAVYVGTGNGPVEAVVAGIKQGLPFEAEFADLELYSLSAGEEASGEAIVTIRAYGKTYRGIAENRDILMAAAHAYMAACNQAAREWVKASKGGSVEPLEVEITIP